jgi:hypothetical protein
MLYAFHCTVNTQVTMASKTTASLENFGKEFSVRKPSQNYPNHRKMEKIMKNLYIKSDQKGTHTR